MDAAAVPGCKASLDLSAAFAVPDRQRSLVPDDISAALLLGQAAADSPSVQVKDHSPSGFHIQILIVGPRGDVLCQRHGVICIQGHLQVCPGIDIAIPGLGLDGFLVKRIFVFAVNIIVLAGQQFVSDLVWFPEFHEIHIPGRVDAD